MGNCNDTDREEVLNDPCAAIADGRLTVANAGSTYGISPGQFAQIQATCTASGGGGGIGGTVSLDRGNDCSTPLFVQECQPLDLSSIESDLGQLLTVAQDTLTQVQGVNQNTDTVETELSNIITELQGIQNELQTANLNLTDVVSRLDQVTLELQTINTELQTLGIVIQSEFDESQLLLTDIVTGLQALEEVEYSGWLCRSDNGEPGRIQTRKSLFSGTEIVTQIDVSGNPLPGGVSLVNCEDSEFVDTETCLENALGQWRLVNVFDTSDLTTPLGSFLLNPSGQVAADPGDLVPCTESGPDPVNADVLVDCDSNTVTVSVDSRVALAGSEQPIPTRLQESCIDLLSEYRVICGPDEESPLIRITGLADLPDPPIVDVYAIDGTNLATFLNQQGLYQFLTQQRGFVDNYDGTLTACVPPSDLFYITAPLAGPGTPPTLADFLTVGQKTYLSDPNVPQVFTGEVAEVKVPQPSVHVVGCNDDAILEGQQAIVTAVQNIPGENVAAVVPNALQQIGAGSVTVPGSGVIRSLTLNVESAPVRYSVDGGTTFVELVTEGSRTWGSVHPNLTLVADQFVFEGTDPASRFDIIWEI